MEPCETHTHHCGCRIIPFIISIGAGIAIAVFAIAKWKKLSNVLCSLTKGAEK